MNDTNQLNYYWLLIILMIPLFLWIRYSTSFGKRSQKALAQLVESLQKEVSFPMFVCIYGKEGYGVLILENDGVRFLNTKGEVLRLPKEEVVSIEYSDLGFSHIITANDRYKFAYIHHTKDAKDVFTMVFGPAWRDNDAVEAYVSALERSGLPHTKVDHAQLIFLPQVKI